MPTRILSWQQPIFENDPHWIQESLNPLVWEFSNGRRFVDPAQPYGPLPDSGLANDGGVLLVTSAVGWPTTDVGLMPNEVWNNGGVVCLAAGSGPVPGGAPMIFGSVVADQLLFFGGSCMQISAPATGSGQLWNNGNVVCIA